MDKTEVYKLTREEVHKILSDHIGKPVSRVRFSSRNQTIICEVGGEPND